MTHRTVALCGVLLMATGAVAGPRPMTVDDLFRFQRVSDPQISPDGSLVVYAVGTVVDAAANKTQSNLWLAAADGKTPPRRLTTTDKKDRHPRWSPDGTKVLFDSSRSGDGQLWVIELSGGEARQLTTISTEAATGIWSRDGTHVAFVSAVYPEFSDKPFAESDKLNKEKAEAIAKSPVKAKVFTRLFYRHWDSYVEDKRQHLFVMKADGTEIRDVTPGDRDAFPTSTTFSAGDDFTFSPDGKFLVFTAVPARDEAWTTNYEICRVGVTNTAKTWETLTKDNPAADGNPVFSPDGTKLAYRAQKKAGYEADRWELYVAECDANGSLKGSPKSVTSDFDSAVDEYAWGADSDTLYFTADWRSTKPIFKTSVKSAKVDVSEGRSYAGSASSLSLDKAGKLLAFARASLTAPNEVFVQAAGDDSDARNVSRANKALLDELNRPKPESVMVPVEGAEMQMWVLKPPGFVEGKKYPLAFLVHGGPQGAWEDAWSFRWNPEAWAAQGYVVALPNPRGSTGYGQKFVDEISGDWGGKCYDDLMKGVEYLEKQPYVDSARMVAAGGSFGGYMMNWFAVQTPKFKALVTHCSVYNFDSMYATTDEVWFDEWEHGGPPWGKNRESYEKHSPQRYAGNLGKHKTPMLIVHNDLDFRCPVSQGQELFTALQRQGVPSRFVNFPDEGHWVLKPANSKRWHDEVFGWIGKYAPPGGK